MKQTDINRTAIMNRDTYYQAFDRLQRALPPPLTDDPEDLEQRDNRAMAEPASLIPVTSAEVKLAVLFVGASAHAEMVLGIETHDDEAARKVRAQAPSMMRRAYGGLSYLMRLQAIRAKREASTTATDVAVWTEHIALDDMAAARRRKLNGHPAADASGPETSSQLSHNETMMRRDRSVSAPDDDAPATLPTLSVSYSEIVSRSSYNETLMRRAGAIQDRCSGIKCI